MNYTKSNCNLRLWWILGLFCNRNQSIVYCNYKKGNSNEKPYSVWDSDDKLMLCSCVSNKKAYVELTADTIGLRNSMLDFFHAEDEGHIKGEHFQAKFLSCVKVVYNALDTDYMNYRYQIVIAPLTNEPIHIKKVHFSVKSNGLVDYYTNYKIGGRILINLRSFSCTGLLKTL